MDIQIKSYLCSDEQDFIHHYGTNTGFTLVYNKVLKSMLISAEAKVLYMLICSYAFGEKDYSFPSQYEMCTRLGWTVDTLKKYLDELEEKGLIKIEISRNMKTLIYKITKLNEVKILYHSELLEMIKPKSARALKKFIKRLREYMASDLFQEVNQAEDPFVYINEVKQFFFDVEDSQEQDEEFPEMSYFKTINNKEKSKVGEVKEIKSDGGGGKEENPSLLKYKQQAKQVAQKIDYSGIQKVDAEKTTINIKKAVDKNYENKPIEEWNSRDFCRYFADRYEEKMGVSLKGNFMKMVSQMKLLIGKHQDNQLLKRMIDVFMDSDI
ncbi:MAG: helix-turn-helix domain-containing protein, partial [Sulfolobaceae archaeon]